MTLTDDERALAAGLEKLTALHPFLRLDVDWQSVFMIVGNLQLALRHPGNVGEAAKCAREFCDRTIGQIERVAPRVAELLRKGDNRSDDVPATITAIITALEASVKLQSHYADLLNQFDGGRRIGFADAQAWIDRLAELRQIPAGVKLAR